MWDRFVSTYEKQMELDGKLLRNGLGSLRLRLRVSHKVAYQKSGTPTVEQVFCIDGSTFLSCHNCYNHGNCPDEIPRWLLLANAFNHICISELVQGFCVFTFLKENMRGVTHCLERDVSAGWTLDQTASFFFCCWWWEHFPETFQYLTHSVMCLLNNVPHKHGETDIEQECER